VLKPIHRVACTKALEACQHLQRQLVVWLCDLTVSPADIIQANLVPPRVPTQTEADWLWGFLQKVDGGESLLARAETLAAMPAADKAVLQAWVNAVGNLPSQFQPHPPIWPIASPAIPKQAWAAFKELMEAFYEKGFRSGLPYLADGTPTAKGGVSYSQLVQAFREAHRQNPSPKAREVCVLCGGPLGETPQVDHWINKGAYPLLSVCADNLLPGCGDCNSSSNKGAKPVHSQGRFADWFHPYLRHANGGIRLDYDVRTRSIAASANNPADSAKVANLDKLLNLATRWTREFKAEYAKQQGVLIGREKKRKLKNQPGQSQADILAHIQTVQDDLLPSEPHHEVHSVLVSALLDQARLDAWQTELGLV
jgi:hypothetical protein